MAKVQFGSGVAYISGRVAGTVHARNRGGSYIRRFSVPVNPSTTFQQQIRSSLATASAAWRDLSEGIQLAFGAWAETHPVIDRLGAAIKLSGAQAFVALNRNAFSAGLGALSIEEPPVEPVYEYPFEAGFTIASNQAGPTMTISQTVVPAAVTTILVYTSPAVSPGITNTKALTKFIGVLSIPTTGTPPITRSIKTLFEARYGTFVPGLVGKRINVSCRTYSNGQVSAPVSSTGILASV